MPDSKEILDDIEKWILEAKDGDTLGIEVFGKHVTIVLDDKLEDNK